MTDLGPNVPLLQRKRCSAAFGVRVGSGKIVIAVAATLLWLAAAAHAQPPTELPIAQHGDFQIDQTRSFLSRAGSGFQPTDPAGHPVGPLLLSTPQNAALNNNSHIPSGSLYAPIRGNLYLTAVPGVAIQFFDGSQIGQHNPDPLPGSNVAGPLNMEVRTTGLYQPGRDNVGNLPQTSPGPQPGNFGAITTALAEVMRDTEWAFDSPLSLDPAFSIPAAIHTDALGNFDAHGVTLLLNKGTEDTISGIAPPNEKNVGSTTPIPVDYNNGPSGVGGFQPAGTVRGNFDPVTFHLVLPINEVTYTEVRVGGTLFGYAVSAINGQIVADPPVPEPSTMTLLALGVVSLLGYAWRRRRSSAACGVGIGSGKVVIAAAVALLGFATMAYAQPPIELPIAQHVDFQIDHTRSWLSRAGSGFQPTDPVGHPVGPLLLSTPQNAALNNGPHIPSGSLSSAVEGRIDFTYVPGVSIQFFTGAQLGQHNPDPLPGSNVAGPLNMEVHTTGLYQPGRDNVGHLPQTSPGAQPGNFGVILTAVAATMRDTEWAFDSPLSLDPSFNIPSALAMDAAGTFNEHGLTLLLNKGTEDTVSGIGPPNEKNVGSTTPIPMDYNNGPTGVGGFQPAGAVMGNLDPFTFHLVLPINEVTYTEVRVNGTLLGYTVSAINGQIVADPEVPEPSMMTLLGLGVVSLLGYAWRRRRAMKSG